MILPETNDFSPRANLGKVLIGVNLAKLTRQLYDIRDECEDKRA